MSKRPSYRCRESGKLSFVCPVTYGRSILLRLTAPSAEGWAIGEALSAASQGLTPPPVCHVQGGGQRLGRQVFASQPRGHWPFWCQMTNLDSPLSAAQHPWPYSLRKPSLPSKNTPSLIYIRSFVMTLWLYMGLCLAVHVPSPLPAGPH